MLAISTIILILVVSYIRANYALTLGTNGLIAFAMLAEVVLIGLFARHQSKSKGNKDSVLLITLIVVFFIAHFMSCQNADMNSSLSKKRGDQLIRSIDQFEIQQGRLPSTLQELVPKFIVAVPSPGFKDTKYSYYIRKDGNYELGYNEAWFMYCYRSSKTEWKCED